MLKLKFIFTILFLFSCAGFSAAQEDQNENSAPNDRQRRPNLLLELDLTREQVEQIRQVNQTNRQEIRAAQQRVGEARRGLDLAIYAEKPDEANVRIKLREFQDAQAEIAELRAETEFSIRKILTPEQLLRFRELRQDFEQLKNERRQKPNQLRMRNQFRNRRLNNRRSPPQN